MDDNSPAPEPLDAPRGEHNGVAPAEHPPADARVQIGNLWFARNVAWSQPLALEGLSLRTQWRGVEDDRAVGAAAWPAQRWEERRTISGKAWLLRAGRVRNYAGPALLRMGGSSPDISAHVPRELELSLEPLAEGNEDASASIGYSPRDLETGEPEAWWCSLALPGRVFAALWDGIDAGRADAAVATVRVDAYGEEGALRYGRTQDQSCWFLKPDEYGHAVARGRVLSVSPARGRARPPDESDGLSHREETQDAGPVGQPTPPVLTVIRLDPATEALLRDTVQAVRRATGWAGVLAAAFVFALALAALR